MTQKYGPIATVAIRVYCVMGLVVCFFFFFFNHSNAISVDHTVMYNAYTLRMPSVLS